MSDLSEWLAKNRAIWTRVYDEVIAPDIQKEWKRRDEIHKKELKQKVENQQILFNHVESQVVRNARLDSENEQLKQRLELLNKELPATSAAESNPEQARTASSSVSADERSQLVLRYDELSKKYQDLSQKIKYLERMNTAVMQKNKDMKESVRAWQEYADRQSGKQKPKNEARSSEDRPRLSAIPMIEDACRPMPSSPRSVATARTPLSCADADRSSPAAIPPLAATEDVDLENEQPPRQNIVHEEVEDMDEDDQMTPKQSNHGEPPQHLPTYDEHNPADTSTNLAMAASVGRRLQSYLHNNPSSSQTTEDESTQQGTKLTTLTNAAYDDNDMPQFVSARSLKRKRSQPPKLGTYGQPSSDGTPIKPFRVKEEPASSPPHGYGLSRKDTIDLDDPTSTLLKTPRHKKRQPETVSSTLNTHHQPRSNSAPYTQSVKQEHPILEITRDIPNSTVQIDQARSVDAELRARSEPSDAIEDVSNVLRHLDPNVLAAPQAEESNKRVKGAEPWRRGGHSIFAESGEEQTPLGENANRLPPSLARARINHNLTSPRVDAVGEVTRPATTAEVKVEHSPTRLSPSRSMQTPLARKRLRKPLSAAHTTVRDDSTPDGRPQWTMKAQQPRQSARKPPVTRQQDRGPLRQRPPTGLTVQDFKPNPQYNQGYTHAFSETFRKRNDRMCLPGCTNPECCGSTFRKFAEAQAPLPLSQEETLQQDYLGAAYDNMSLSQMAPEERQELVLQARTRKLAKETGKHRETYERRRTPPGFWRVDFPTTQEQQEDREKAEEQERQIVQERWLEAQRKGGRWIFRDE